MGTGLPPAGGVGVSKGLVFWKEIDPKGALFLGRLFPV
jgi:hypothetical protein